MRRLKEAWPLLASACLCAPRGLTAQAPATPALQLTSAEQRSAISDQRNAQRTLETKVDAYLAPYLARHDFNGVVLVARGDSVLLAKGYGLANFEFGAPNSARTKFRIASITKTFTAAAITILVERGLVRYDDRLSKYLPDFPRGDRITIEHLLLHQSGVANPDYASINRTSLTPNQLISAFKDKPPLFEPGTNGQYSNAGYILLAAVIARASGRSYEQFLKEEIFDGLALAGTLTDHAAPVIAERAAGYVPGAGPSHVENVPWYDMSAMIGSGSLLSTAQDLHRWGRAVHTERLFKRSALRYPYGWGKRKYYGRELIEQSGSVDGFTSYLAVYFADSTYVVCLTNVQANLNERCGKDVAAIAFGLAPERPPTPPAEAMLDRRLVEAALGEYESSVGRFRVMERDGALYVQWIGSLAAHRVTPVEGGGGFVRVDRSTLSFVRDGSGRVTAIVRSWGGEGTEFRRVGTR